MFGRHAARKLVNQVKCNKGVTLRPIVLLPASCSFLLYARKQQTYFTSLCTLAKMSRWSNFRNRPQPVTTAGRVGDPLLGTTTFRRGWCASSTPIPHDVTDGWDELSLGAFAFRVHPALSFAAASDGRLTATILGDGINLDNSSQRGTELARQMLSKLQESRNAAVRFAAYLGGRFAVVLEDPDGAIALTDCAGTLPIFWSRQGRLTVLSSYVHLVGELTQSAADAVARSYIKDARELKTPGTIYVPGVRTPFIDVRPILPNHLLDLGVQVSHQRYYPFPDTKLERDPNVAFDAFHASFTAHTEALTRLGRVGLSLTGGLDSRAALAASRSHLGVDAISWTYIFPEDPPPAMLLDTVNGNHLAFAVGLPHKIIPLHESQDKAFVEAYRRTFTYTPQFPRVPHSYHDQLPQDLVQLQCMVSEIGTGFYKNRRGEPNLERLSYLYCPHPFGKTLAVREAWEEHHEYAPIPGDTEVDFHDLFYWETRIGRWGALRIQEIDLAHHIVSPFNSRTIIEALQGPPLAERKDKQALKRFIGIHAPDFENVAITS